MGAGAKFSIVLLLVATVAVGGYLGLRSTPANPHEAESQSRAGFEPSTVDLGERMWGQVIDIPLHFVNHTEKPIRVGAIHSSCGCTIIDTAAYAGQEIAPGAALDIAAQMDTETNPGDKVRDVLLLGEGANQRFTATIHLRVWGTWELSANEIDFGQIALDEGELLPVNQAIEFISESDALVGDPIVREPWLECTVSKKETSPRKILFRLKPDQLTPGRHAASVILQTDCDIKPNSVVTVRVVGTRQLTPSPLHVFLVGDEASVVTFHDVQGKTVRLATVEAPEAVSAHITDDGRLRIQANDASTEESITIHVVSDSGLHGDVRASVFE